MHPDLMPILGEAMLSRWIWESLRQLKETPQSDDGGQLPLFGNFGGEIRARDDGTPDQYMVYYRRYLNAASSNRPHSTGSLPSSRIDSGTKWARRQPSP